MFEWIMDPTVWAGLLTLIVLEVVLGIDNLIFIAILADKLPPEQRDRARVLGLTLALGMRLILLASISWLINLTQPLFALFGHAVSVRDLILILGGFFLLYKATSELHEHLDAGSAHGNQQQNGYSAFGIVIAQIVALDAVFSIDSVITAVGMVDHLAVMMVAVIIAVGLMLLASKPLTRFVSSQPTIILLCLGFLLMIGFSLVAEGFGIHIPKGYLYGAIGFSIMIEALQELRRRNYRKEQNRTGSRRTRTAEAIMRLIGGSGITLSTSRQANVSGPHHDPAVLFDPAERRMIQGVLSLADKPITAIMTQRREIDYLDIDHSYEQQVATLLGTEHSRLIVIRDGQTDAPLGMVEKKSLLEALLKQQTLDIQALIRHPLVLLENVSVVDAVEQFRVSRASLAFVVDEFGTLEGIATKSDILEEIAGELPEPGEITAPSIRAVGEGCFDIDASEDIIDVNQSLPEPLPPGRDYTTLAGLVLDRLESLPYIGASVEIPPWRLEVRDVERHRIKRVRLLLQQGKNDSVQL
ncbi:TerC family protein [Phytohalomonas tamaricis]|uniref:TerC family protein n=1 Tax=Phytohalomonas tamaricis TaxID=2081032 RepID=UPI000D0AF1BA